MMSTQFKVENVFGDLLTKDSISSEQITKPNTFFSQIDVNNNFCIDTKLYEPFC